MSIIDHHDAPVQSDLDELYPIQPEDLPGILEHRERSRLAGESATAMREAIAVMRAPETVQEARGSAFDASDVSEVAPDRPTSLWPPEGLTLAELVELEACRLEDQDTEAGDLMSRALRRLA